VLRALGRDLHPEVPMRAARVALVETSPELARLLNSASGSRSQEVLYQSYERSPPMLSTIEAVATIYGVFMSLGPLLQARKMKQRRSSGDISILYIIVLVVGFSLYLAYGISISNRLLIITNTVSIAATATTLLIALTYRNTPTTTPAG
jgi:uncharacterized protein with PQ loop repeat